MRQTIALTVVSLLAPTLYAADGAAAQGDSVDQESLVPISVTHASSFIPFDPIANPEISLAANTFLTIFGPATGNGPSQEALRIVPPGDPRIWSDSFVDRVAPTSLDGVRVLINGKAGFISYLARAESFFNVDFDQINLLAPDDDTRGLVTVEVLNGEQRVATSMVNLGEVSPGLFAIKFGDISYVIARTADTGRLLLDPDVLPTLETRPARVGEVILMFGTGYGKTEPPLPTGELPPRFGGPWRIPDEVRATIGGVEAALEFAGISPCCVGVYQFNVKVPPLPDGNHLVTIETMNVNSQPDLWLTVANE